MRVPYLFFAALLLILIPTLASGQECVDYHQCGAGVIGQPDLQVRTEKMVIDGGILYVTGGGDGLTVYSLADPENPEFLASVSAGCFLDEIIIDSGLAYLSGASCGVRIFDISDPTDPYLVGSYTQSSPVYSIAKYGECLYVAESMDNTGYPCSARLRCVDVSDPGTPVSVAVVDSVSTHSIDCGAMVRVNEGVLYFSDAVRLRSYALTDPFAPEFLSELDNGGHEDLVFVGDVAYLAFTDGFRSIDISLPGSPALLQSWYITENPLSLCEVSGVLCVGTSRHSVEIFDVSDPKYPAFIERVFLPEAGVTSLVDDGLVYAGSGLKGMGVISLGTGDTCPEITDTGMTPYGKDLVLVGDFIHVAAEIGLRTYNVSTPETPYQTSFLLSAATATDVAVSGDKICVLEEGIGLHVATGAGTDSPYWISSLAYPNGIRVAAQGNVCWVLDLTGALIAVDISDPVHPVEISELTLPTLPWYIDVNGDIACVGFRGNLPRLIDISNPAAPFVLGTIPGPTNVAGVAIRGALVVLAENQVGVHTYDIEDPTAAVHLGTCALDLFEISKSFGVSATTAYLGQYGGNTFVIDFKDPERMLVSKHFITGQVPNGFAVGPESVFLTTDGGPLQMLQAQCDGSMLQTPVLNFAESAQLFYWDVPNDPLYVESYLHRGTESGFELGEALVCTPGGFYMESESGHFFYVLRHKDTNGQYTSVSNEIEVGTASAVPEVFVGSSLHVGPNPFNPTTTISFTVGQACEVDLAVFDMKGRLLERLYSGRVEAGEANFTWHGRDDTGHMLPSGSYFVRAVTDSGVETCRMMLLK